MKKTRADARWNLLQQEQRQLLETWLFEERLSYSETLERAQKELGFKGSISSLRRFYENIAPERMLKNMIGSGKRVREINEIAVSAEEMKAAGMKVVAQLFLNGVVQSPENMKDWSKLARLLLQSESNEIRYRLKQEENELRRKELEFEREKFQYDIMEQGLKVLPQLQELEERGLSRYEKNKRQNALRRSMWGPRIPEPLPENEEEEKEMARQEAIFEEEHRKWHEEWLKRFGHIDQRAWRNKTPGADEMETSNTEHPTSNIERTEEGQEGEKEERPKNEFVRPYLPPLPPLPAERMEGTEEGQEQSADFSETSNTEHRTLNIEGAEEGREGDHGGVEYPYGQ